MNKILKLTLILFLVCAVVAGVLGGINELTKDTITAQKEAKTAEAYATVLESQFYTNVIYEEDAFPAVDTIAEASNGYGHVVLITVSGAQGNITLVVGVDNDYKCTGVSIVSHSETSGLGANAASTAQVGVDFRAQFVGQDETCALTKAGGEIDALTGATITSRAVTGAVATAIEAVKSLGLGGSLK